MSGDVREPFAGNAANDRRALFIQRRAMRVADMLREDRKAGRSSNLRYYVGPNYDDLCASNPRLVNLEVMIAIASHPIIRRDIHFTLPSIYSGYFAAGDRENGKDSRVLAREDHAKVKAAKAANPRSKIAASVPNARQHFGFRRSGDAWLAARVAFALRLGQR